MIFSSNKVYNIIKWAVLVALPGISTFIVLLGTLAGVSAVKFSKQPDDTEENK
ncbi:hypothetical protein [Lactococcus lactis]|jgi:hypothetical protein|uniref:hypothetical protein n=1 Tax=Lactococcus lactis TaxID=1358 RepID=UPI0022E11813|nr:hypothetical protein [Lactococcus lactis]